MDERAYGSRVFPRILPAKKFRIAAGYTPRHLGQYNVRDLFYLRIYSIRRVLRGFNVFRFSGFTRKRPVNGRAFVWRNRKTTAV